MKLKPAITIVLLCCLCGVCNAQTAVDSTAESSAVQPKVETIDGIWALSGYLGKKLVREFGSRLNLDRDEPYRSPEPVKVTISVGAFRVERTELR